MMDDLFKAYEGDPSHLAPLSLAYIGDGVFELYVRQYLLNPEAKNTKMHNKSVALVNAPAQAGYYKKLEPYLTETELEIAKRGRNAKSRMNKSSSVTQYHLSTGFEALVGYLYLNKEYDRLKTLLDIALTDEESTNV